MTPSRVSAFVLRRRVLFHELDSAGIVHFSNFFRYLEEAEHALWRAAGLSIAPPGAAVGFPRVAASFDYKRPLRFEEEIDVHIRIAAIGRTSLRYECEIKRDGETVATGSVTSVCVSKNADGTMAPTPIPRDIVDRFEVAAGHA